MSLIRNFYSVKTYRIIVAIILAFPLIGFAVAHYWYAVTSDLVPTWFYSYDMPYYMANARQYWDDQSTWLFYSNPYDYLEQSPRIYFQPLIYLYGLLISLDLIDPGLLFTGSGLIFTLFAFYKLQELIQEYCQSKGALNIYLTIITTWGGGLFVLFSLAVSLYLGAELDPFYFDPEAGWWMLNFGRNFISPTEAFYHALVICLYLSILRERYKWALFFTWLLALSHPFTGIQYSIILASWFILEKYLFNSERDKKKVIYLYCFPLIYCILYYLVFLPSFTSHKIIMAQWSTAWLLSWQAIFCAYVIVGVLAIANLAIHKSHIEIIKQPFNRFVFISFCVSFVLANHELFIKNPVLLSSIISGIPPTFVAITGFCIAIASLQDRGRVSIPVGNAYTSISEKYSLTLSGYCNEPK